jgi:heme/copper-type cytochrome/quinol oxidase subunit 4
MRKDLLSYILFGQLIILSTWTVLEKAFTKAIIGSIIALAIVVLVHFLYPAKDKTEKRRLETITVFSSVLFLSIYILQLSSYILGRDLTATFNLPYPTLMNISYALMYLLVVCLVFFIPVLLFKQLFKRKTGNL